MEFDNLIERFLNNSYFLIVMAKQKTSTLEASVKIATLAAKFGEEVEGALKHGYANSYWRMGELVKEMSSFRPVFLELLGFYGQKDYPDVAPKNVENFRRQIEKYQSIILDTD